MQGAGVITSVKHFIGYEQETNRNMEGNVSSISSNIDDKTIHELYLWPFVDTVHAGSGCVMCSYNRINNSFACQNSKAQNGLLKGELGFEGFIVSDWDGQHGGVASAEAGLDVAMPNSAYWGTSGEILAEAVNNGSLAEERVTDMAMRVIAAWYQLGQDVSTFTLSSFSGRLTTIAERLSGTGNWDANQPAGASYYYQRARSSIQTCSTERCA